MPQGKAPGGETQEGSHERSYARKIADLIAFLVPFLLLTGLALGGGGYEVLPLHLAGILAWILVAALLIAPMPERIRPGRSFALVGGLILALALLSAVSSVWSSSVAVSLAEFERNIAYLGFFTAGYLVMRTPKQREWFALGLAAGISAVVLLALGDRLIPGGEPAVEGFISDRLSFPLGYWNGDGVTFGCGVILFTWLASVSECRWLRAGSVAMAALSTTALYLTYSRGGILVAALSLVLVLFLSRHRLRILGTAVIAVAASVPILLTIDGYPAIAGTGGGDPSTSESLVVLLVALVCITLGALAAESALRLARRRPDLTRRPLEVSRDRRVLVGIAGAGATIFLALILVFGDSVWEQFTDGNIPVAADPKERFTELSGSWRYEFNQVAIDTFVDNPLIGTGAGTYRFEWNRQREAQMTTLDAHSFYLQNLAELGIIGGLVSLALALSLIWLGVLAWRRRRDREAPVMLALTVSLLLAFGLDWFWRLGATGALLMLLAAWIAASMSGDRSDRSAGAGSGTKLAGLLAAWLAIVALAVPAIADRYVKASADSVRAGEIGKAEDQARMASRLEPWNPKPHMQLATIAGSRGDTGTALSEIDRAVELEPENWQARVLRFQINFDANRREAAERDFQVLREINPLLFGSYTFEDVSAMTP